MLNARSILLVLGWTGLAAAGEPDFGSKIDAIFKPWDSMSTPGCAVEVAQEGQLTLSRAYGAADLEHRAANEPSTLFEVGSVTKQFTAAAILLLAGDGKLKLTDDVRTYIPELPLYGVTITIDHLLSHTSGIRDWGILEELAGWERTTRVMTNADALNLIIRQRHLDFVPGDEFGYSNSGFVLLAIIAERVTGQSLQEFSRKNLFEPLGLVSTQWRGDFRRVVKDRSIAYMNTGRGYVQTMPFENVYGDAGILTTVHDLVTWTKALDHRRFGEFVSSEFERRAVLNNGRLSDYAHGLRYGMRNGAIEIWHAGGIGAYRAWVARFPDHQLFIAVACNAGDPDYTYGGDYFGHRIVDLLLPAAEPTVKQVFSSRPSARTGLFVSTTTGMPMSFERHGNELAYRGSTLTALSADRMALTDGVDIVFESDDRFRMESINGNVETFQRTAGWTPDKTELDSFTGRFYSDEIDATYDVKNTGTGLVLQIENRPGIAFPLTPVYRDAFVHDIRLGANGALVRFYRDDSNVVNELSVGWRIGRVRDLRFALTSPE
jgi:CubicO group peptidase (beta-lactamase class C family)